MFQGIKDAIVTILGIGFLIVVSPVLIPLVVLFFVRDMLEKFFIYLLLKKQKKSFILFNSRKPGYEDIIKEQVIDKLIPDLLVFPEGCLSRLYLFFISKPPATQETTIILSTGMFALKYFPLGNALVKFKKGNPIRLKNMLFKLKASSVGTKAKLDNEEDLASLAEFRSDISSELVSIANSYKNPKELYLVPIEDYEEDFKYHDDRNLDIAWRFIECWNDEAEHNFQGFYPSIKKEDWSEIATSIASSIEAKSPIRKDIEAHFGLKRINGTRPSIRHIFFVIVALLFASLCVHQCTLLRSPSVCYQINNKDCN